MERRTKIVLIGSLVANLFLAGALAGALVIGSQTLRERGPGPRAGGPGAWTAFQSIPQERRETIRALMREPAMEAAEDFRAGREARRVAAEAIAAPVYDPVAVAAALTQARDHDAQARARLDAALASRLAQLSVEERAAFAEAMTRGRMLIRGPGGEGRGGRGGPPGGR